LVGENGEKIEYEPNPGMFFNTKDLCMIEHIDKLMSSGIAAFKIEGRMRDPIYISEVTRCYREAIDSVVQGNFTIEKIAEWKNQLHKVFNRGFHTGFYFGRPQPKDIESQIRGNVSEYHKEWIGKVTNFYRKVGVVEIEISNNYLNIGDEIIFENMTGFFYKETIKSMYMKDIKIEHTGSANFKNHLVVTIEVKNFIPTNSNVYVLREIKR
jgi:putative protease